MPEVFQKLAFHEQLILAVLFASLGLCFLVGMGGYLIRRIRKNSSLPPVPLFPGAVFPAAFDYCYTIIFLIGFSLSIASVFFTPETADNSTTGATWLQLAISLAVQTCLYLPFIVRFYLLPPRPCSDISFWRLLPMCLLCLAAITIPTFTIELFGGLEWIMEVTRCPEHQDIVETFAGGSLAEKIVIAVAAVIIAPITEECCFRGFLYNILKQHATRWLAISASALFFGAIHGSVAQLIPLTIFGIVQCLAYDKARSLRLPILVHASFNSLSLLYILLIA